MKNKRNIVLVLIIVLIVLLIGVFFYERVLFNYSVEDLMDKLDGYWVNTDEEDECQVVIFDKNNFIRGNVNTEPEKYSYVVDSKKVRYNEYDLVVNMKDVSGSEEEGTININLAGVDDGKLSLRIENIDEEFIEYEYISDNEEDVFLYCEQNFE